MNNNIENTIGEYSPQIEATPKLVSIITDIFRSVQIFIARVKREQAEVRYQMANKNRMKIQLHRDWIDQMSLVQKLKLGLYRH